MRFVPGTTGVCHTAAQLVVLGAVLSSRWRCPHWWLGRWVQRNDGCRAFPRDARYVASAAVSGRILRHL